MQLPYRTSIIEKYDEDNDIEPVNFEELGFEKQWDDYFEQKGKIANEKLEKLRKNNPKLYAEYEKQYYNKFQNENTLNYDNYSRISGLINNLSLDFTFGAYFLSGIDLSRYNVPYCFLTPSITDILVIEFKEFVTDKRNTIKQCKNCEIFYSKKFEGY